MLEILHQALGVPQLPFQLGLVITDNVLLLTQVSHVGLKKWLDVGSAGGLAIHELPLGLQHFVLLLKETHLREGDRDHQLGFFSSDL